MDSTQLFTIGKKISSDLLQLVALFQLSQSPKYRHLAAEEQRFKLWAHSLGLYQQGHASLDYRLRDTEVVKSGFSRILEDLQSHLESLLAIERNERLPYEAQEVNNDDQRTEGERSDRIDSESDNSYDGSDLSSQSDGSSFHEVDFRLNGLSEAIDALYSLADQIRSSLHRPQRNIEQLYKHVPVEKRDAEIKEREEIEIAAVCYLHRQHLSENTDKAVTAIEANEIFTNYSSTDHWLLRRAGIANVRRKQQFVYWNEHVIRLNRMQAESLNQKAAQNNPRTEESAENSSQLNLNPQIPEETKLSIIPVSTTTATMLKPGDLRSVISHQTRVSTIISPGGKRVEWPDPPKVDVIGGYFICPYCKTLCPERYLLKNTWIIHLIHDLQPYHCTYEQCMDPTRLYGSRKEWINHENQHIRVWHCHEHNEEFETQPEYVQHLEVYHPDSTPEHFSPALVAAAVGRSNRVHRDCPLCTSGFSDTAQMQSHLIFHLERLAQLALHNGPKITDGDTESGHSSQSHQGQMRGRQDSVFRDFDTEEEEASFDELIAREVENDDSDGILLSEATLNRVSGVPPAFDVDEWLQNLVSEEAPDESNIEHKDISLNPSPPSSNVKPYLSFEKYTVGWVCSNSKALSIATAMLDERHLDSATSFGRAYLYTLGSIGDHNIVISCPRIEDPANPIVRLSADNFHAAFPSVQYCFVTGIGSGMPPDIRLGDVVISTPIQHRKIIDSYSPDPRLPNFKLQQTRSSVSLPSFLLSALWNQISEHERLGSSMIPRFVDEAMEKTPSLRFQLHESDQLQDLLFESSYRHVDRSNVTGGTTSIGDETCHYCDVSKAIDRPPREIRVHSGLTISGHQAIESAVIRDEFKRRLGSATLCIEQEAAGFSSDLPYLLIRGICDYADSHRNKSWQNHATAAAAACVKEVLGYVSSQSAESSAAALPSSQIDALHWLSALDYDLQLSDYLEKRAPESGRRLLDSDQYQEWICQSGKTLFLHGSPGTGKSMMAAIVLDHLSNIFLQDSETVFCYVFCTFDRAEEETVLNLMCSLLKQLSQRQPYIPQSVEDLFTQHRRQKTKPSLDEISSALRLLLSSFDMAFIVIDALDECESSNATQLISEIFALQVDTGVNVFATSRSLPHIIERFQDHNSIIMEVSSMDEDIDKDIRKYIESNIKRLPSFVNNSPDLLDEVKDIIVKSSNGMFLLARLLFESIVDSTTPKSMMNTLKESQGLQDMLDAIMIRIQDLDVDRRDLAMNTFLWITFAFRPLTVKELQHALAVEVGESGLDEENIPGADDIKSVCAGLVVIDSDTDIVQFCHKLVEDWFRAQANERYPNARLYTTRVCITYISFDAFRSGISQTEDDLNHRFLSYPFYAYAAYNWGFHALDEPEHPDILLFLGKQANVAATAQVIFMNGAGDSLAYVIPSGESVALHVAAFFGLEEAMKVLFNRYDVNLKAYADWTPLMVAAMTGQDSIVELLLTHSADIEAKDHEGRTALSLAAFRGVEKMVELLVVRGAKVDFHHADGSTPLLNAIDRGYEAIVRSLLAHGADIELKHTNGDDPVSYAAKSRNEAIANLLLAMKAKSST